MKVKQIRIRGAEAEVDIERPSEGGTGGGTPTLMTAYLQWEVFTGWHAQRLRIWRIGVDAVGSIP
ncbi:MAG: hypothetical protein GC164_01955 [Phycisphaera sp.]|nr:hypothetical protein [Phycisphaera sp.]